MASVLGVLSREDRSHLTARSRRKRFDKGELVFCEGDPSDWILVLTTGRLKVSTYSVDGGEFIVASLFPGETVGELGVLSGAPRSATVEATVPSTGVTLWRTDILEVLRERPELSIALMRRLADMVRRTTGVASDLVFLALSQRVAKFLLASLRPGETCGIIGVTQSELAASIGASRQRVNACLQKFHREGWVELGSRTLRVVDADAFRRLVAG